MITHPDQAKLLLVKHPQFSYALFQALLLNKIVPSDILERMLASSRGSSTSSSTAPPSATTRGPTSHLPYSASVPSYPYPPQQPLLPTAAPPVSSLYSHQPAVSGQPYYRPPVPPAVVTQPAPPPAVPKPAGLAEISDGQRVIFPCHSQQNSYARLLIRHY